MPMPDWGKRKFSHRPLLRDSSNALRPITMNEGNVVWRLFEPLVTENRAMVLIECVFGSCLGFVLRFGSLASGRLRMWAMALRGVRIPREAYT